MRVTRDQTEKNRAHVVETASRLFREHGFGGVGVADIMKSAGLTRGSFYGQFGSKDDRLAGNERACARRIEHIYGKRLSDGLAPEGGDGCDRALLSVDAASRWAGRRLRHGRARRRCRRAEAPVKEAFAAGLEAWAERLSRSLCPAARSMRNVKRLLQRSARWSAHSFFPER